MLADLTNVTQLKAYKENYTHVFVTTPYELQFQDSAIVSVANLTIKDNSPYGKIKKRIGKYYSTQMYVYEVKDEAVT